MVAASSSQSNIYDFRTCHSCPRLERLSVGLRTPQDDAKPPAKPQAENNFGFFICRWGRELGRLSAEIRARCINGFPKLRHPESMAHVRLLPRRAAGPHLPVQVVVATGFPPKRSGRAIWEKDVPLCHVMTPASVGESRRGPAVSRVARSADRATARARATHVGGALTMSGLPDGVRGARSGHRGGAWAIRIVERRRSDNSKLAAAISTKRTESSRPTDPKTRKRSHRRRGLSRKRSQ